MQSNYSDGRLAELLAHAQDGKLNLVVTYLTHMCVNCYFWITVTGLVLLLGSLPLCAQQTREHALKFLAGRAVFVAGEASHWGLTVLHDPEGITNSAYRFTPNTEPIVVGQHSSGLYDHVKAVVNRFPFILSDWERYMVPLRVLLHRLKNWDYMSNLYWLTDRIQVGKGKLGYLQFHMNVGSRDMTFVSNAKFHNALIEFSANSQADNGAHCSFQLLVQQLVGFLHSTPLNKGYAGVKKQTQETDNFNPELSLGEFVFEVSKQNVKTFNKLFHIFVFASGALVFIVLGLAIIHVVVPRCGPGRALAMGCLALLCLLFSLGCMCRVLLDVRGLLVHGVVSIARSDSFLAVGGVGLHEAELRVARFVGEDIEIGKFSDEVQRSFKMVDSRSIPDNTANLKNRLVLWRNDLVSLVHFQQGFRYVTRSIQGQRRPFGWSGVCSLSQLILHLWSTYLDVIIRGSIIPRPKEDYAIPADLEGWSSPGVSYWEPDAIDLKAVLLKAHIDLDSLQSEPSALVGARVFNAGIQGLLGIRRSGHSLISLSFQLRHGLSGLSVDSASANGKTGGGIGIPNRSGGDLSCCTGLNMGSINKLLSLPSRGFHNPFLLAIHSPLQYADNDDRDSQEGGDNFRYIRSMAIGVSPLFANPVPSSHWEGIQDVVWAVVGVLLLIAGCIIVWFSVAIVSDSFSACIGFGAFGIVCIFGGAYIMIHAGAP